MRIKPIKLWSEEVEKGGGSGRGREVEVFRGWTLELDSGLHPNCWKCEVRPGVL